jgi:shikimate kinase
MAQGIDDIRRSRDTALAALDTSIEVLANQIARITTKGPLLTQLTTRFDNLMSERNAIFAAATDAVLQLPEVVAAAAVLINLANQMNTVAQNLPTATNVINVLAGSTSVLSSAQHFANTLATAQQS